MMTIRGGAGMALRAIYSADEFLESIATSKRDLRNGGAVMLRHELFHNWRV